MKFSITTRHELSRSIKCVHKEDWTTDWIDDLVKKGDIFYDLGANVGMYSLYTAKKTGCHCYAFEPVNYNVDALERNIRVNDLQDKITILACAVDSKISIENIFFRDIEAGYGKSRLGEDNRKVQQDYKQSTVCLPLDFVVEYLPFPTHIKMDIEGTELNALNGMKEVLSNKRLKSILIETDSYLSEVNVIMESNGFSSYNAMLKPNKKAWDLIFVRK